jgi:hypothetical protein
LYCAYTNADSNNGIGISIITTPTVAKDPTQRSIFYQTGSTTHLHNRHEQPFERKALDGRGVGLISTAQIAPNATIISERPLFLIARSAWKAFARTHADRENLRLLVWRAVLQLPDLSQRKLRSLAKQSHDYEDEIEEILLTNGFGGIWLGHRAAAALPDGEMNNPRKKDDIVSMRENGMGVAKQNNTADASSDSKVHRKVPAHQAGAIEHVAIFPTGARINHACRPNSHYLYDNSTMTHRVYALRSIEPGEEITHSYISDPFAPSETRRRVLRETWGFDCSCELCSASEEERNSSDERLNRIKTLREWLNVVTASEFFGWHGMELEELIDLYDEEGLVNERISLLQKIALMYQEQGNNGMAKWYRKRAARWWSDVDEEDDDGNEDLMAPVRRLLHRVKQTMFDWRVMYQETSILV